MAHDNESVKLDGYTRHIVATSSEYELDLMVSPDAQLDDCFVAWDRDELEFINVCGWLFEIEDAV